MTPITLPPFSITARAVLPIRPTLVPPYTSVSSRCARARPSSVATSKKAGSTASDEEQKTVMFMALASVYGSYSGCASQSLFHGEQRRAAEIMRLFFRAAKSTSFVQANRIVKKWSGAQVNAAGALICREPLNLLKQRRPDTSVAFAGQNSHAPEITT